MTAVALLDGTTVAGGALPLAILVALAAGFVSFASPCVLPLVPGFLGYVTGLSDDAGRRRTVLGALLFVAGFTVVFVTGMAAAGAVNQLLVEHRTTISRVSGVVVILLALVFLGVGTQRQVKPSWRPATGLAGAPLLGVVFAVGWTPCTGPTLAAIWALLLTDGGGSTVTRGIVLAVAYSIGLGLPFLLVAAGVARFAGANGWLRRHQRGVQRLGGALLLVVGVLLLTGLWDSMVAWLQGTIVGYEVPL